MELVPPTIHHEESLVRLNLKTQLRCQNREIHGRIGVLSPTFSIFQFFILALPFPKMIIQYQELLIWFRGAIIR